MGRKLAEHVDVVKAKESGIGAEQCWKTLVLASRLDAAEDGLEEHTPLRRRSLPRRTLHSSTELRRVSSTQNASTALDMDHVSVPWWDFLWTYLFVAPNAVFLYARGISVLLVRQALNRRGWLEQKPLDERKLLARLVLESMEVLQFACKRMTCEGEIGCFCWPDFPMLDNKGNLVIASLLQIEINLVSKEMVSGDLDGRQLTPKEAIILVWFHTIFAGHVKLHALANWGVNDLCLNSPFVRRNSIITVMYNHFGKVTFPRLASFWAKYGVSKYDFSTIGSVIDFGLSKGIAYHGKTRELQPHSEIVDFVIKVRNSFMNTFQKHKNDLKGIDGEAMFVGTILHSLDHTLMEWNLEDPLWLDVDSTDFGLMAEVGRFVRVGFVPDLPGLMFEKGFKDAPHEFYRAVYAHASRINQRFADHMDTCIIK